MELIYRLYNNLLAIGMIFLSITASFCLLRAILGPRFTDRIVAINMIGMKTIILICILAFYMREDSLLDISIVYALISFLPVVALAKVYLTGHGTKNSEENPGKEDVP